MNVERIEELRQAARDDMAKLKASLTAKHESCGDSAWCPSNHVATLIGAVFASGENSVARGYTEEEMLVFSDEVYTEVFYVLNALGVLRIPVAVA